MIDLFGTRGIGASILQVLLGCALGWLFGGPDLGTKGSLLLGTAQRNIGAALVVGGDDLHDPKVMVMLVVAAMIGLLILLPLTRILAKKSDKSVGKLQQSGSV